jgi:natural product precursor
LFLNGLKKIKLNFIDMKILKLNKLSAQNLVDKQIGKIKGGGGAIINGIHFCCTCGCQYEGTPGGSSTAANCNANRNGNKTAPIGVKVECAW